MTDTPKLFHPLALGPLELANRIMVSPMCQYSAVLGVANDWHRVHLGALAQSGAGLVCIEATAVSPEARITPGCLGLYDDDCAQALNQVYKSVRSVSSVPMCLQLAHAGRKASSAVPWEGGALLSADEGGWHPVAPSPLSLKDDEFVPHALDGAGIDNVINDFVNAARRAVEIGFEAVELHMAHGYLMHQFLSPIANHRDDQYGGSLVNRMRLPLKVFSAVRDVVPEHIAVGVRLSASDWIDGGWDIVQSVELCKVLESSHCQFIDVSSGGISPAQKIALTPGYQVPFAEAIKAEISIPVIAVGLITEPIQANAILDNGQADMVALGRAFLYNPRWPWHAAAELGGTVVAPRQYWRSMPAGTPPIFGEIRSGQR